MHQTEKPKADTDSISILRASLTHCCPKCGKASLYDGILSIKEQCSFCQFPLRKHDAGDGPAFFAMSIAGTLIIGCAILLELTLTIPLWLHAIIWLPGIILLSIYFLRLSKSFLIASQYHNDVLDFKKEP